MDKSHTESSKICATCNTALQGKFCHACGEKALQPEHDFSVRHFLEETFESFTHLDSKLLRSFKWLFLKPGFLTAEFIAGRRVRYMKPIPLFIIAGVLFYFFFSNATAFFSNLGDMNRGYAEHNYLSNTFQVNTESLFSQKVAVAQREPEQYWKELSADASRRSKAWLFLIAPVWGLLLWLLFYRKIKWVVPHLVFALHGLTFFVLLDTLFLLILKYLFHFDQLGDEYVLFLAICFGLYCILAVRRAYKLGRFVSILAGVFSLVLFLLIVVVYRQSITIWTLSMP